MTAQPETLYGADDLTHLEGLDAVRKRPGMYIGSTDSRGIGHLVNEILDNSTDEGVAGHATRVEVTLHADGSVQVDDDGRGIPTDVHAKSGLSGVELVLTRLHAGGKFGGSGYKTSGGLHGVGRVRGQRAVASVRRDGEARRPGPPDVLPARRAGRVRRSGPGRGVHPAARAAGGREDEARRVAPARRSGTGTTPATSRPAPRSTSRRSVRSCATPRSSSPVSPTCCATRPKAGSARRRSTSRTALSTWSSSSPRPVTRPVCGTVLVTGAGTYQENAADENGVMRSNVERQRRGRGRVAVGHRLRAHRRVLHEHDPQRARRHAPARASSAPRSAP